MEGKKVKTLGDFWIELFQPEFASKFHAHGWIFEDLDRLSSCRPTSDGVIKIKDFIEEKAGKIGADMARHGGGWLKVSQLVPSGKKKTESEKAIRCSILCQCFYMGGGGSRARWQRKDVLRGWREGLYPPNEKKEVAFWLPKSALHVCDDELFVPEWKVENALDEQGKGSDFYFPVHRAVWPRDMKEEWIRQHVEQLPTEKEVLELHQRKELEHQIYLKELEASPLEEQARKAESAKKQEEKAKKLLAANIKKWEKQAKERFYDVTVQWSRRIAWKEKVFTLHHVDVYLLEKMANIIHEGDCIRISRNIIEIIDPAKEEKEKTESAPICGFKKDGTPRLQLPGPGRPKTLSTEEARNRCAQAQALWKEVHKDKMREYRRRYREKKKTSSA